jgi:TPP-dependent pyruvate/acetoin dehydrogenase alpha subunit
MLTVEELIAFEQDIAAEFNAGKIRAPIHLSGGNEQELINFFQGSLVFPGVQPEDWVCGSWRMHLQCLLKGVPPAQLKADILAGHSITLCYPEYRIISSAIVGGILPIALGIAWSIKRNGGKSRVYCFCGDMTATTGMFHEVTNYAAGFLLPITFIVEDNGLSVCTPTQATWGDREKMCVAINSYEYDLAAHWPHSGAGKRITF